MSAEASPGASPKRCKNAKNERLPSIPIRLRSPAQLKQLDAMVQDAKLKDPKMSRNALVIAKVFDHGAGDPSGDAHLANLLRVLNIFASHRELKDIFTRDELKELAAMWRNTHGPK